MKSSQRLLRAVVTRAPASIYQADKPCLVVVWVPPRKLSGEENSSVAITDVEGDDVAFTGVEIGPDGTKYPVFLQAGESLFAVTKDESHVAMSVIPAEYAVLHGIEVH